MSNRRYVPHGGIRDINSMKELRYHKMRVDLATEFLEDKIEDNISEAKYMLSPGQLFRTVLTSLFSMVGSRRRKRTESTDEHDGPGGGNLLMDGVVELIKAIFRAA